MNSSPNRSQRATNFKNIRAFTLMFLCEKCEKPFGTKRSLQRHIKTKHQEAHIRENQGDEEVTVSANIEHLDSVDVGDLVVMPFDPLFDR